MDAHEPSTTRKGFHFYLMVLSIFIVTCFQQIDVKYKQKNCKNTFFHNSAKIIEVLSSYLYTSFNIFTVTQHKMYFHLVLDSQVASFIKLVLLDGRLLQT